MAAADLFPSASFDGIKFPYTDRAVRGSQRHHVHEYPHTDGGAQEPLGRRLYEFEFTCDFDESMNGIFAALYPRTVVELFAVFGEGRAADLVVPGFGTFSARCINWDARKVSKIRSGEKLTFKFLEVLDVIVVDPSAVVESLPQEIEQIKITTKAWKTTPAPALPPAAIPTDQDIADVERLGGLVSSLINAKSANDFLSVAAAQSVMTMATKIDARPYLRFARAFAVVESLHKVFSSANTTRKDALQKSTPIIVYTTPKRMSVIDVSTAIYGDTSHARDLLVLNSFEDAMAIPSNTAVQHYKPTATKAA